MIEGAQCRVHIWPDYLSKDHVEEFVDDVNGNYRYLCIAMELGEQSLWQYVRSQGGILTEEMAREFFCHLILGLEYCHEVGVANRYGMWAL